MATPFLGEIKVISFNFAPKGWALCNGQLLPINQNQALFSILGTQYGGDGRTTFALPNLQGRVPVHIGGSTFQVNGTTLGEETHTLVSGEMPAHTHQLFGSVGAAVVSSPTGNYFATSAGNPYAPPGTPTGLRPETLPTVTGGGQAHQNMQPYLVLGFVIALQGIFPSRN